MTDSAKVAFLFPGQGAQTVGMGAAVCAKVPAARKLFDRASSVLGYDLYRMCTEGPAAELDSTVHSQPALFVASLAALEQLKENAPELVEGCSAAAGLSLGEYTALVFAGALDFADGLRVVQRRGYSTFVGIDSAIGIEYVSVNDESTRCHFCPNLCQRTFIDTKTPAGDTARYITNARGIHRGTRPRRGAARRVSSCSFRTRSPGDPAHAR